MNPLGLCSDDAPISDSILEVRLNLHEFIGRLEESLIISASVSNHNLRGVLVGHHYGGLGQSGAEGVRVVRLQGLL